MYIYIYTLYIVFLLPPYISPLWKLEMTLQTAAGQVADDRSILVRPLVMAWPKKSEVNINMIYATYKKNRK